MQAIVVQWWWCRSRFQSGRVGPCCQKQQTASDNQLVAVAALRWPVGTSVRAAQTESGCNGITMLWQQ